MNYKYAVSVLIPVYNGEKYITECLDSVTHQTLNNIEIIIINDGSTDKTLELIKNYLIKDDRIVIINKENTGYGDSLNEGIKKSTGEYIGIVESDDVIPKTFFEELYSAAISNTPHIDVVKEDYIRFWGYVYGNKYKYCPVVYDKSLYGKVIHGSSPQLLMKMDVHNWNGIYRAYFIKSLNIEHNTTPGASYQDTGFRYQYATQADSYFFINKGGYRYRNDNEGSSIHNKEKALMICAEFDYIRQFLLKKNLYVQYEEAYTLHKYKTYKWNYGRISDDNKVLFLRQWKKEIIDGLWSNYYSNKYDKIDRFAIRYLNPGFYIIMLKTINKIRR